MARLQLGDTLRKSIEAPIKYWREHVAAYAIFVVAPVLAIQILVRYVVFPDLYAGSTGEVAPGMLGLIFGLNFLYFLFSLAFVVVVHRTVAGVAEPWKLAGGALRYLLSAILVSLILVLPMFLVMMVFGAIFAQALGNAPSLATIVLMPIIAWIMMLALATRFILAFPAAALGRSKPIRRSIQITNESFGPLFLGVIVTSFLIAVIVAAPTVVLSYFVSGCPIIPDMQNPQICVPDSTAMALVNGAYLVLGYFSAVIGVSFLTYSFLALDSDDVFDAPAIEPTT